MHILFVSMVKFIIIIIVVVVVVVVVVSLQRQLVVFHWSLSDSESPPVS